MAGQGAKSIARCCATGVLRMVMSSARMPDAQRWCGPESNLSPPVLVSVKSEKTLGPGTSACVVQAWTLEPVTTASRTRTCWPLTPKVKGWSRMSWRIICSMCSDRVRRRDTRIAPAPTW